MKYLCLGYYDVEAFDTLSADELRKLGERCAPFDEELAASGARELVASLAHRSAVTLRPGKTGAEPLVSDGPFAETKEQIGSFFLVEARDFNEAIRIAGKHPAARIGAELGWALELRPIEQLSE